MARLLNMALLNSGLRNYTAPLLHSIEKNIKPTSIKPTSSLGRYMKGLKGLTPQELSAKHQTGMKQVLNWWNAKGVHKNSVGISKLTRRSFAIGSGAGIIGLGIGAVYSTNRLLHRKRRRY